ncbi:hypothetical protein CSA17_03370 [bacterium DOLJORAL78_65_58]|nr:MAG: hypothetical protein CSB20_04125 [bacterium DOLZORAL124_64_63]PIE76220.1 MAG: hypothetical protein CSA17_03370 [bacterium DOLJORAL78_65_58]
MNKLNRTLMPVLVLVLMLSITISGQAEAKKRWEKINIPQLNEIKMPSYERVALDNGMIVYLAEDHQFPLVELSASIDVGSIYEPADKIGLAAMTGEVMRSGGTETIGGDALDELVEARGMTVETWIGQSEGGAYLSVLKEDTRRGMELLADILMHPAFPEDKIKLAKEGQKAGISRRNDDPMSIASREAMKAVFGADHPMARHAEYATIAAVTRQDMVDFHNRYFGPNRMYLVVIGDFNSREMINLIESSFAGWASVTAALPADPEVPDFPRTVNVVDKDDLTQTTVLMGHKGVRADSPYYAGLQVANRILGGGFASRLFNEVRSRQGLAYSVGSSPGTGFRFPGLFMAYTMTKSESSEKTTELILAEIQKMLAEEVTAEELEHAKDGILNSEVFNFDTKREILDRMVMFERLGYDPDFLQQYQQKVQNMTAAQVLEACQAVWHPERMTILAVGNYADFDGDFSTFGPVNMVDIEIPEPPLDIPAPTAESLAQGKAMLEAYAEARGGLKKFQALKGTREVMVLDATIQGMALNFTIEKTVLYPDHILTMQKTPFGNVVTSVNGDTGWAQGPQGMQDLGATDVQKIKAEVQTEGIGVFRNLDTLACQALAPTEVDGVPCLPVHVSDGDDYQIFFIDTTTHLVKMVQAPGVSPMTNAPVTEKLYVDEYADMDGFLMPKTIRITNDDEPFATGTFQEFEANPKVDMSIFAKPKK